MKISQTGIALIKQFEGCELTAYQCSAKVWTIGYGHTGKVNGKPIVRGMKITQAQAEKLLLEDITVYEKKVNTYKKYNWSQNEFDALVSFAFNIGSISQLTALGTRNKSVIASKIPLYNKANGKVVYGLSNRREKERILFLKK